MHPSGPAVPGGIDISRRRGRCDALDDAQPKLIGAEEIDFERVAALRPDLILGVYSGMTDRDYDAALAHRAHRGPDGDHPITASPGRTRPA